VAKKRNGLTTVSAKKATRPSHSLSMSLINKKPIYDIRSEKRSGVKKASKSDLKHLAQNLTAALSNKSDK
jgi:bifunctional DNase/RNase